MIPNDDLNDEQLDAEEELKLDLESYGVHLEDEDHVSEGAFISTEDLVLDDLGEE